MDTSPAVTDTNVNPRIVENYDGKDIVLNAAENIVMKVEDFPELLDVYKRQLLPRVRERCPNATPCYFLPDLSAGGNILWRIPAPSVS